MAVTLDESYRDCRQIARSRAKNFYYSFLLLDKSQRDAMCAIYAFMRYCDDLSDQQALDGAKRMSHTIAQWRIELSHSLEGQPGENPLWPAFSDAVARY